MRRFTYWKILLTLRNLPEGETSFLFVDHIWNLPIPGKINAHGSTFSLWMAGWDAWLVFKGLQEEFVARFLYQLGMAAYRPELLKASRNGLPILT